MLQKIIPTIIFSVKYEIKRSLFFIIGIFLILFVLFSGVTIAPLATVKKDIAIINILDYDNTALSKEFADFILTQKNITASNRSFRKLTIPKGFERQFYEGNATLETSFMLSVNPEIYNFQLQRVNETGRITPTMSFALDFDWFGLFLIAAVVGSFANFFISARKEGTLYFMCNHMNFWAFFLTNNLIMFGSLISAFIGLHMNPKYLLLLGILFLLNLIVIFNQRRNSKVVGYISWLNILFVAVLLYGKFKNLYYMPLFGLTAKTLHPIIIVDILIFGILLWFVSKIKFMEK